MRCRIQQWSSWRWSQPSWRGDFLPLQLMMCVVESREPGIRIKGWEVLPTVCIVGLLVINSRFLLEPLSTCECHCGGLQDEKTRHVVGIEVEDYCWLHFTAGNWPSVLFKYNCKKRNVLIAKSLRMNNSGDKYTNRKKCSVPKTSVTVHDLSTHSPTRPHPSHHHDKKIKMKELNATLGSVALWRFTNVHFS